MAVMSPGLAGRLPPAGLGLLRAQLAVPKSERPFDSCFRVSGGPRLPVTPLRPAKPTQSECSKRVTPRVAAGFRTSVAACACACVGRRGCRGKGRQGLPPRPGQGCCTVARGGARANSRSAAAGRAQADTGKACDWPPAAPMQTS